MTAGHGIAHSEESPDAHPPVMHGLQLWIALPESARHGAPRFEHHATVPVARHDGVRLTTVVGAGSPVLVHTPLSGLEVVLDAGAGTELALERDFEHGVLVMTGVAEVDGQELKPGSLLYLDRGHPRLRLAAAEPTRLFVLGG